MIHHQIETKISSRQTIFMLMNLVYEKLFGRFLLIERVLKNISWWQHIDKYVNNNNNKMCMCVSFFCVITEAA